MSDIAVKVEDLTIAYYTKPVVWDVDLEIKKGKITAILGPNGAGKSTLLKSMLNLIPVSSGKITFFGKNYKDFRKEISYVPQSESVDWDFPTDVLDVVIMGTYGKLGWIKRAGKYEKEKSLEALKKLGMEDYIHRQISDLSGGQQQRVFLARALVQDSEIYFLDEPLKGVDAKTEKEIMKILKELKENGKTIVVVHHDLRTVREYFDEVVLLNKIVVASGKVDDVFVNENIDKAYRV
ncbi:MAG: metal ABC transporter ATP-binding protein [Peptoniphilaceae bacterium]|uniref:metal ABC transporter ATP-binding protein n=1 Tax=Parvimonas sp. TaxID=1944660 RepID=UPI0025FADF22|nr:metal ABC transporter ATP-binding protein [Parvimonas sp.]MCI5997485.1 metal ABC transporter ATP-binding protein [Parvimonas sp.]MDD7764669.1 metal ABC transporter ATP-binding protein [Peptoniphilaceae bacterium]MDY3050957.1 metal ABC transporter ATP-binding protein [Parvimonas sp.]